LVFVERSVPDLMKVFLDTLYHSGCSLIPSFLANESKYSLCVAPGFLDEETEE
jgi:hypothetical protein